MRHFAIGIHPFLWVWRPRCVRLGDPRYVSYQWLCVEFNVWPPRP